jgi:hypothetical protein
MASKLPLKIESGKRKRFISGTDWVPETTGGTGQTSFSTGDILVASAPNTLSKVTIGSSGQVLGSNGTTASWTTPVNATEQQSLTNNEVSSMSQGEVVYSDTSGTCKLAKGDSATTSNAIGIVCNAPAASASALVQVAGTVTLTTGQWDAVAGTTGGLVAGSSYYLSASTAGHITATAPDTTGNELMKIGHALSNTQLAIALDGPDTV